MFPLLRRRSKKSKDRVPSSLDPAPPLPKPLTMSGFSVTTQSLVHRDVRHLPISAPFTKVEFRNHTTPSSPMQCFRSPPHDPVHLSDATTFASPNSVTSPLSSESEHGVVSSPASSPVELSSYDRASAQYYDADEGSGLDFDGRKCADRVSYYRWSASSDSVIPRSPSEHRSRASTDSSVDHHLAFRTSEAIPGSSQKISVYRDQENYVPHPRARSQPTLLPRQRKKAEPSQRVGVLRWENDLDGFAGQQKLFVYIYDTSDEDLTVVDQIPVMFPPELNCDEEGMYSFEHINRPMPQEEHELLHRWPSVFERQNEELEIYRKELEYIAAIPSPSSRGPTRVIGVVTPSITRKPVPNLEQAEIYQWKVTQKNVIGVSLGTRTKWCTGSILGEGTFGRVYLVYNAPSRIELAMKVVYIRKPMSKIVCEGLVNELKVFERLAKADAQKSATFVMTPNTATGLWAWQSSEDFLHIISDFCPGGDLYEYIGRLSHDQLRLVIAELFLGLDFLHKLGIVHHDLKPENVLIDAEGHCVIADYGGSKFLTDGLLIRKTKDEVICTLPYAAPELLAESTNKYKTYDETIDYWALGATIFMLATGDELFSGDTAQVKLSHMVVADTLHARMRGYPSDLLGLTSGLLALDPTRRLRGAAFRDHQYFASFRHLWSDIVRKRLGSPIPFVRNVGGQAHGYTGKCKVWPSQYVPENEGGAKTMYLLNALAKECLELPHDGSFDVPTEHTYVTKFL
ncbi:hypothetical protein EUX98_g6972 [Antrodiella citrinella]|uniref:Protein kinase domain-containing protein n=1 Tax=Antrodiella citrinella TaxID=2447956 RepID=A0A4S4MV44_9APHY|nr:hypothetical protein EUX98_g6972 [Antrodiella citrinella]